MNKRPVSAEQLVRGQMVAVVAEPETTSGQKIKVVYVLPHQLDGADLTLLFADQSD